MFGLFKRKSEKEKLTELYNKKKEQAFRLSRTNRKEGDRLEKEKLIELYNKKKEQAFRLSRTNRKEGDRLEKEANDILNKIDKIK